MTQYWVGVAYHEHVQRGVLGGFAQVCHGRPGPLMKMSEGDWIVYYSPKISFKGKNPCQSFTAVGRVCSDKPYTFAMSEDFIPWRRNVAFVSSKEAPIANLLQSLSFIQNKQKWGLPFRRGCFEIARQDFQQIAKAMGVTLK